MNEAIGIDFGKALTLKQAMQEGHPNLSPCKAAGKSLLDVPDELLSYIWAVLRNGSPLTPEVPLDRWTQLLDVLRSHWIIPLLYRRIGSLPQERRPPEPITNEMRQTFLHSRVRCLHMEKQLGEIIEAFQNQEIQTLVLRGPGLALSLYPDPAMRPSCDLDLLVLPEQVIQAREILERLGYKCLAKRFENTREFFREEEFVHQKNPRDNLVVDLHWVHWELYPFFESGRKVGLEDLFKRAWETGSSGLRFKTLHPVDALIHGAIHATMIHKRDIRLIWIYDMALLAGQLEVPHDWEILQENSLTWGARLPLENSLRMAQFWLGLQLPDGFNDFSTWPRPTADERAVWAETTKHHWVTILLKRSLTNPSMLLKRTPALFRLLFPHPDIVRFCYPPSRGWLLPLSYVRRWYRWFEALVVNRISLLRQKG